MRSDFSKNRDAAFRMSKRADRAFIDCPIKQRAAFSVLFNHFVNHEREMIQPMLRQVREKKLAIIVHIRNPLFCRREHLRHRRLFASLNR